LQQGKAVDSENDVSDYCERDNIIVLDEKGKAYMTNMTQLDLSIIMH